MHDDVRLAKIVSKQSWTVLDYSTRDLGFNSSYSMPVLVKPGRAVWAGPSRAKGPGFLPYEQIDRRQDPKICQGLFPSSRICVHVLCGLDSRLVCGTWQVFCSCRVWHTVSVFTPSSRHTLRPYPPNSRVLV